MAERWVRQGGEERRGTVQRGCLLPVALCFHTLELTGALLLRGGVWGHRADEGWDGKERERWGVGGQGYDVTAKLQQEENTEMVQHFFKLWTAKS